MNKLTLAIVIFASIVVAGIVFVSAGGVTIIQDLIDGGNITKTTYDIPGEKYPMIELSKSSPIVRYWITGNTENCISTCYTTGVAEVLVKTSIFDSVKVKDMKKGNITKEMTIASNIKYYIKTGVTSKKITYNVITTECVNDTVLNSTGGYSVICTDVATKTDEMTYTDVWTLYNKGAELAPGNYTWKYQGVKGQDDLIDVYPGSRGFVFNEWAVWGDGFNTGLKYYWNMTNTTSTAVPELLEGKYNWTISADNTCSHNTSAGIIGEGQGSLGLASTCRINISSSINKGIDLNGGGTNGNMTMAFWYKATDNSASGQELWILNWGTLQTTGAGNKGNVFAIKVNTNTIRHWGNYWDVGNTEIAQGNGNLAANTWYFYVIKRENGTFYSYVNGTKQTSTKAYTYNISAQSVYTELFRRDGGAVVMRANIDEIGIWNRSLTDTEIWDLYNNGTGLTYKPTVVTPTTTCTYSGSGNWAINCSESCNLTANAALAGKNLSIIGSGNVLITSNVTGYSELMISGLNTSNICTVYVAGGGKLGF